MEGSTLAGKKKKQFLKKTFPKKNPAFNKFKNNEQECENENDLVEITEDEISNKIDELNLESNLNTQIPVKVQQQQQQKTNEKKAETSTLKFKDYKQVLPLSTKAHRLSKTKSLVDCLLLFDAIYENQNLSGELSFEEEFELADLNFSNKEYDEKQFLNLNLLGNRKSTIKLLDMELEELHSLSGEAVSIAQNAWLFDVWKGNIEKLMNELDSNHLVNDFFFSLYQISITPTIYKDNKFFENYLLQLLKSNEHHKVALLYIVSYKIHDAIELYLDTNQYQFALCLAQLRLDKTLPDDQILFKKVLFRYALYSSQNGDYETAILAYTRIKDLSNASKSLMRRVAANEEQKVLIQILANKYSKHDSTIFLNTDSIDIENEKKLISS